MFSSWLQSVRDDVHRDNAEVYEAVCLQFKAAMEEHANKTVQVTFTNMASDGTSQYRAVIAEAQYAALHNALHAELLAVSQVNERFMISLQNILKCDVPEVTLADLSRLSDADCRRVLLLVWKLFALSTKAVGLQSVVYQAYGQQLESKEKLLRRWDAEACKQSQEVDRLRAEAEAAENRLKQLTTSVKICAKRLAKLSTPPRKAQKEKSPNELAELLNAAVSDTERTVEAERKKATMLQRQLADAAEQLGTLRAERNEASGKCFDLEKQLKVSLENGVSFERKCEELEEKVRCPTCMDREKNVTFACGHAYCEQCATEWNTYTYNCKRPNSGKPVKFRYPLFLC